MHWRESTDRRTLADAVDALKRGVERAYFECRDDDADEAHSDLVAAEWRLRQAERRA
jgi:hypothetical protein